MRSMVEGACRTRNDRGDNAVHVSCHVACPHPQHAEAILPYELVTHLIRGSTTAVVHGTVHLDHEARADAAEIDHIGSERMLFAKSQVECLATKTLP